MRDVQIYKVLVNSISMILSDPDALGTLAQTFVFHELTALLSVQHEYSMYRYRDNQKRQIDFILEKTDQLVGLAEIGRASCRERV